MTRICLILMLFILGCVEKQVNIKVSCGNCRRIVYDGPAEVDSNGQKWPIGVIEYCKPWDINCVSNQKYDIEYKSEWGYQAGRKDALEFYYKKEMDPKTHHFAYIEGYNRGYKEVIDVCALQTQER